ncbi:MAG: DUF1566 domain-containing protein [Saprospiraceae bacterium]|uniref:DUF1566 domain-containing protein n=1 Tax=Candidatus Defluviibacterium haderslevense TaxID=2981993 RepID=A0A9D7S8A0_9BACT|nr:DUF1566 domain-containing protein [Candidatus Defluviibacterium haderslevense]
MTSTSQILSVPYALYSERSKSLHKHYIGEFFGGGIIFYVFNDLKGEEHGLIVSLEDYGTTTSWSNITTTSVGANGNSTWNGINNSNAIINQNGHVSSAAQICEDLNMGGYSDWYLPSIDELNLLRNSRYLINKAADLDNNPLTIALNHYDYYWSSTEALVNTAFLIQFGTGDNHTIGKGAQYRIRAIRQF